MTSSSMVKRAKTVAQAQSQQQQPIAPISSLSSSLAMPYRTAPVNGGPSQPAAAPASPLPRPFPIPETQELYNAMREAELEQEAENIRVIPGGRLPLPSPHSAAMSRSPSHGSTTSLSHNMGHVDLHDYPATSVKEKKRKAGRHGPLDEPTKARAAFFRKIGSCQECKSRKVRCHSHHDFSLFEEAFQNEKRRRQENPYQFCNTFSPNPPTSPTSAGQNVNTFSPMPTTPSIPYASPLFSPNRASMTMPNATAVPMPNTPSATPLSIRRMPLPTRATNFSPPRTFSRLPTDLDLLGVGGDPSRHLNIPTGQQASVDLEKLLVQTRGPASTLPMSPVSPISPSVTNATPIATRPSPFHLARGQDKEARPRHIQRQTYQAQQAYSMSPSSSSVISIPAAPDNTDLASVLGSVIAPEIPIGRLVLQDNVWECQGSVGLDPGTGSAVSFSSTAEAAGNTVSLCLARYTSLAALERHYRVAHSDFRPLVPPFLYLCISCRSLNTPAEQTCLFCNNPIMETWHYGSIASSLAGQSERAVPVSAGGSASGLRPSSSFPFTYTSNFGYGGAGNGGSVGNGASYGSAGFHYGQSQSHSPRRHGAGDASICRDAIDKQHEQHDDSDGHRHERKPTTNALKCDQKWDEIDGPPLKLCFRKYHRCPLSSTRLAKLITLAAARRLLIPILLVLSLVAVAFLESLPLLAAEHFYSPYGVMSVSPCCRLRPAASSAAVFCIMIGAVIGSWVFRIARRRIMRRAQRGVFRGGLAGFGAMALTTVTL